MTMNLTSNPKNRLIHLPKFSEIKGIEHFVTARTGGVSTGNYASFNLSEYSGDDIQNVRTNRSLLCNELGISIDNLYIPFQTHSNLIAILDSAFLQLSDEEMRQSISGVDALITNQRNICIGVTTADCVPILLYDPVKEVVGAVHAGWKGTVAQIAQKTVEAMTAHFGSFPADIAAAIGPSIGPDAFEVGEEVAKEFEAIGLPQTILREKQQTKVDLWSANKLQLLRCGLLDSRIEVAKICTYTAHEQFFSARRLGINSGRGISGIMLK